MEYYIERCPHFYRELAGHGERYAYCSLHRYSKSNNAPDCKNCPVGSQYDTIKLDSKAMIDKLRQIPMKS